MISVSRLLPIVALPLLLVVACSPTGGGAPISGPPPADSPAAEGTGFELAGTWTDTDVVGENSCGAAQPVPGTSRVTEGIILEQKDDQITLTAPVNIAGTQTITTGTLADDGSMTLTGTDSGNTITLTYQAQSDSEITGSSQVDTGTCVFNFTNSLVRTD